MNDYDTSHEEIIGLLDQARAKLFQLRYLYSCKVETEYRVPPPYEKTEEEIFPDNEP